ncbi:MAG: phosphotransferase, partial [Gammaproteobacteria bacterium]|nr:phosphotransferase [Gammaproteobacteria bacterium]
MSSIEAIEARDVLCAPAPALSQNVAKIIAYDVFGIQGVFSPLQSERDQNIRIQCGNSESYVLKIANPAEDTSVLAFQTAALQHIANQDPTLPVPRVCRTTSGEDTWAITHDGQKHVVRLLTYLDGQPLSNCKSNPALRKNMGNLLARLGIALRGFFHSAAGHELLWDLKRAAQLRDLLIHISDTDKRSLATGCLDDYEKNILPMLNSLRAQVIHNDLNPDNTLVDSRDCSQLSGVIDFGDMVHSALINDLAVAAAYQLDVDNDPIDSVCELVSAYHELLPLFKDELVLLPDLIRTRALMTVSISAWRSKN